MNTNEQRIADLANATKITKPYTNTWLGRRATTVAVVLQGKASDGVRWIYTKYLDDADPRNGGYRAGTYSAKKIEGDGRKSNYRILVEQHEVPASEVPEVLR